MLTETLVYLLQLLLFCYGLTLLIAAFVPDYLAGKQLDAEKRMECRLEYSILCTASLVGFAILQMA